MSEQITDSRFHMWRTVVALAHADGVVVPEEEAFVENYISALPFTDEQRAALREDLRTPQNAYEMFEQISERSDQAEFFQFARMLIWCDGDLDRQEDQIFKHLQKEQMRDVGIDNMQRLAEETRDLERIRRMREDEVFEKKADDLAGLQNILKGIVSK